MFDRDKLKAMKHDVPAMYTINTYKDLRYIIR